MDFNFVVFGLYGSWICHGADATMSGEPQGRMYPPGTKVRVLRGQFAGQVMTIAECTANEIRFVGRPSREIMSKENVEPAETQEGEPGSGASLRCP